MTEKEFEEHINESEAGHFSQKSHKLQGSFAEYIEIAGKELEEQIDESEG